MDKLIGKVFSGLHLSEAGRNFWEPVLPHLWRPLGRADEAAFLVSVESAARSAGLSQSATVATLLEAYVEGSETLCAGLAAQAAPEAEETCRRLLDLEHVAMTRIAAGYATGLEDTIGRLRHEASQSSPLDASTGVIKPGEIAERLALEVNRCQRMDLSLGLLGVALADADKDARSCPLGHGRAVLREAGACLRDGMRRYDSIGLTGDGDFLLVLPGISHRGLAGAAERLRRDLGECAGPGSRFLFALAHYDYVDVPAGEMLTALEQDMRRAREEHGTLAWS
jgi:GGDEF domain-containing protein